MHALFKMLLTRGDAYPEHDERSVETVLQAAARRLGEVAVPGDALRQLKASNVNWAWQMAHLSDADWDQIGFSLGFKTAAKAELAEPTTDEPTHAACENTPPDLTDRMRRFLLLPDADGREAKPLGEMSALFLGLLTVPVGERQSLLMALCELMALVSGLFISAPFDLRGTHAPSASGSAAASIWVQPPTLADGMDALVAMIFLVELPFSS